MGQSRKIKQDQFIPFVDSSIRRRVDSIDAPIRSIRIFRRFDRFVDVSIGSIRRFVAAFDSIDSSIRPFVDSIDSPVGSIRRCVESSIRSIRRLVDSSIPSILSIPSMQAL